MNRFPSLSKTSRRRFAYTSALALALLMVIPPVGATTGNASEHEAEARRAQLELSRQQLELAAQSKSIAADAMKLAMADQRAAEGARLSEAERAELDAARQRLEQAREEMQEASREVAELARKASAEALEMKLRHPAFSRAGIGVVLGPDEAAGVAVVAITPDSPAAKAGLRAGDRLLVLNGQTLDGESATRRLEQVHEAVSQLEDGQEIGVDYQRDGKRRHVELQATSLPGLVWLRGPTPDMERAVARAAELRELPQFDARVLDITPFAACETEECTELHLLSNLRWRDLRLTELDNGLGRYFGTDSGALVLRASGDELAALEVGDVIKRIDGRNVDSPRQVMDHLRDVQTGQRIQIEVLRDHKKRSLEIIVPQQRNWRSLLPPAPPVPPAAPAAPVPPAPRPTQPGAVPPAPAAPPAPPSPPSPPPAPEDDEGLLQRVIG